MRSFQRNGWLGLIDVGRAFEMMATFCGKILEHLKTKKFKMKQDYPNFIIVEGVGDSGRRFCSKIGIYSFFMFSIKKFVNFFSNFFLSCCIKNDPTLLKSHLDTTFWLF